MSEEKGMEVSRPVFIVGSGRSGSTIFFRMFAWHPDVAWLSSLLDRKPDRPDLNRWFMKAIDYPLVGGYLSRRNNPNECYAFWNVHCKGFRRPCRDLLAEDVTEISRRKVRNVMGSMLNEKRSRLLVKITGWPRIGYLKEIFPDAKFVHMYRDGRAVANSHLLRDFWMGWQGPQNWRWGELPPLYRDEWEHHGRSFVALAAIQWKMIMDASELAVAQAGRENVYQIRYEDFCSDVKGSFRKITEFCELDYTPGFDKAIEGYNVRSANNKWKEDLTERQREILNEVLKDHLEKYGYPL